MPITGSLIDDNIETHEMSGLRYLVCVMIRMQAYTWRRKVLSGSVVLRNQISQSKTRQQDCRLLFSFYRHADTDIGWAQKSISHNILRLTSANAGRFSKFVHRRNLQEF